MIFKLHAGTILASRNVQQARISHYQSEQAANFDCAQ